MTAFVRKRLDIPQSIQISHSSQNLPDYITTFIPFAAVSKKARKIRDIGWANLKARHFRGGISTSGAVFRQR
jgi:hypothetical protein